MHLSKAQKEAVLYTKSPALVIAGAGSGKTRTLTAKISYLLKEGFDSKRILAITFTNKAAEEMKSRLIEETGLKREDFPWVRTYHSACLQILKDRIKDSGYSHPIQILSGYQQEKTMQRVLIELNIDKKQTKNFIYTISLAKNSGNASTYIDKLPRIKQVQSRKVFNLYEKTLEDMNALDFDNILLKTRDLLSNNKNAADYYRDFFQFILIDEYQDSNNLQEELTSLLLGHNRLFCVGDDWQAVYGFRGSNVNHFLSFQKNYPKAKIFRLEENYRSADEIVQAANLLIANNNMRMQKHCYSDKKGGIIENYRYYSENEEAEWVGRKIVQLKKEGVALNKIAIIYRTKFCSLAFEKALRSMNIPYSMLGSRGFFERMEILDLNAYLTASVFEKDDSSFERIVNTPKRGIGPAKIKDMQKIRKADESLQDAARKLLSERMLSPKLHASLEKLLKLLEKIRDMNPGAALEKIIEETDYFEYLKQSSRADNDDFHSRKENIEELIYTAGQHENINSYLEEAALIREDKDNEDTDKKGVNLATAHASKGLEFHSVFVVACEEELFPHLKSMQSEKEVEEERRLMYVAMTRAKRCLFLTSSSFRRGRPSQVSRFIKEIRKAIIN